MRRDWWLPLLGVLFVVLVIVSFTVAGEPPDPDEVQEVVEHYRDNDSAVMVGALFSGLAATALVFFGSVLRDALEDGYGGARSILPRVAFAGTVMIALGAAIDATISFALADSADDIDPTATQALQALWNNDFMPFAIGAQLLLLGAGLAIIRTGMLPKWLGWLAVILGVVAVSPAGFVAFVAGGVWILIISVMLTLQRRAPTGEAVAP